MSAPETGLLIYCVQYNWSFGPDSKPRWWTLDRKQEGIIKWTTFLEVQLKENLFISLKTDLEKVYFTAKLSSLSRVMSMWSQPKEAWSISYILFQFF